MSARLCPEVAPSPEQSEADEAAYPAGGEPGHRGACGDRHLPTEKFVLPADLDGRAGRYRAPHEKCVLIEANDQEGETRSHTRRSQESSEAQAKLKADLKIDDFDLSGNDWAADADKTQGMVPA